MLFSIPVDVCQISHDLVGRITPQMQEITPVQPCLDFASILQFIAFMFLTSFIIPLEVWTVYHPIYIYRTLDDLTGEIY